MGTKIRKNPRSDKWVKVGSVLVLSAEAEETLASAVKPSPEETEMQQRAIERQIAAGKIVQGKDGNYYPTKKVANILKDIDE